MEITAYCSMCGEEIEQAYGGMYGFVLKRVHRQYRVHGLVMHYFQEHGYLPPEQFIEDMLHEAVSFDTRIIMVGEQIGNISGAFDSNLYPVKFTLKYPHFQEVLQRYLEVAEETRKKE